MLEIIFWTIVLGAVMAVVFAAPQKTTRPSADKLALGEEEVRQLVVLLDADRNGTVSKKEFMDFMEAEFDRLDADKNGELDVKELKRSRIRASKGSAGK
jgi:hypothetical protein